MTLLIASQTATFRSIDPNAEFTLKDIIKTLPKDVFVKDSRKAWSQVIFSVVMVALGYLGLVIVPWYLLPILWVFTGTALTGFFVVGHDAAHHSFSNHRRVNDVVGHLLMLPLLYPFHGWRILHNYHHKHTNKHQVDNAWQPWTVEEYKAAGPFMKQVYRSMRGRLWWLSSIVHWAMLHFQWDQFEGKQREQIKFSALVVMIGGSIGLTLLTVTTGWWGLVKFWFVPWLVYHFWMSTFTLVHHTAVDVQFTPASEWNEAMAQLAGTIHCNYPRWVEVLCHDINVHIPHHISTAIPAYNLRKAHASLNENWGEYIKECEFNWDLIIEITDNCHLYDPQNCYQSFEDTHTCQ
jgi:omega-6 fatty acid desaturase (delta-12 desaturase)